MVDVRFETCVVFGGGKETATPLLLIQYWCRAGCCSPLLLTNTLNLNRRMLQKYASVRCRMTDRRKFQHQHQPAQTPNPTNNITQKHKEQIIHYITVTVTDTATKQRYSS